MIELRIRKEEAAKLFWLCAGIHLLLWTLIPALTTPNVLTDVIEGYAWGHEWTLGTYKHPPLAAWILESLAIITHRANWVHFLASQIAVIVAFWAVWQAGRRIVSEAGALIGAFLLVGVAYYNLITPEFNPNVLQLPFWALMGWSFHRAVKDNRIIDWLLLGLWAAASMYTKYSSLMMIASLAIVMVAHPDGRRRFHRPGPWLTVLVSLVLFAPHLIWLEQHLFLPFDYAESQFEPASSGAKFLLAPLLLMLWQAAACIPAILVYLGAFRRIASPSRKIFKSFDGTFLTVAAFGPFVLTFAIAATGGFRIHNMWGTPFWNFLGLWAVFAFHPAFTAVALRRFAYGLVTIFVLGVIVVGGKNIFEPYITHRAGRIYFPGPALSKQLVQEWESRYHTPLRYIIGDIWAAGNVAFYAPERPHVLINGDYSINPSIALEDVKKYGGIIVWCRGTCTSQDGNDVPSWYWTTFAKSATRQSVLSFPQQTGAVVPPAKIGWAIVPPAAGY